MMHLRSRATSTVLAVLLVAISLAQRTPVVRDQACLGGTGFEGGSGVMPTLDGGVIVVGHTSSSNNGQVNGFQGGDDFWVVKLDHQWQFQWQTCAGGSGIERASDVAITADGGYLVVGSTWSTDGQVSGHQGGMDLWMVKLDAQGNYQWSRCLGGSGDEAAASIDGKGDSFLITGHTSSTDGDVTGAHGGNDIWLLEVDADGELLWQRCLGGTGDDLATKVHRTADGCMVVGQTTSNDGDVSGNHGGKDLWLVSCGTTGAVNWQRCLGGSLDDWGNTFTPMPDGGYVAAGGTMSNDGDVSGAHGATDFWVVRTDAQGDILWQNSLGGSATDYAGAIVPTKAGRCMAIGNTLSNDGDVSGNHGSWDAWAMELQADGTLRWQACYGGTGDDRGMRMEPTPEGDFVCTGWTYSNNGDVSGNHGGGDLWAFRLSASYNIIRGTNHWDLNANGVLDPEEPRAAHKRVVQASTGRQTFTDPQGNYQLYVGDTGTFVVEPEPELLFTPAPATWSSYFPTMQLTQADRDFSLQPNSEVNELRVALVPLGAFRPGFTANYRLHYSNEGNTVRTPTVSFKTGQPASFISASVPPSYTSSDSVAWILPALAPFGHEVIFIQVQVDGSAPMGSFISASAHVRPLVDDAIPANNSDACRSLVTSSFDPNDILVDRAVISPEEVVDQTPLTYTIRFQNTGTDTAFTVLLRNPLPPNARPETFRHIAASHDVVLDYSNEANIMWFRFNNILLPDSTTNEPLSHGYVRYTIVPQNTLLIGDSVLDQAAIFFDFNAPIITNTAYSVVDQTVAVNGPDEERGWGIQPVPATTTLHLALPGGGATLTVFDAAGRLRSSHQLLGDQAQLDVSSWPRGIHLLRLTSATGVWTRRVVLQ